jgi:hypothetical protein
MIVPILLYIPLLREAPNPLQLRVVDYYIYLLKVKRGSEFPTARRILLYIFFKRGCEFPTAARCRILFEQDAAHQIL